VEYSADQQVSFYCGTGWRASETFMYARRDGLEKRLGVRRRLVRMEQQPENPVQTGVRARIAASNRYA
jgi:thiosulfate/3-mercaptopyruvate sulfurtransferase